MELITYKVLVWIEDNKVRCASQMCDECPKKTEGRCVPAVLMANSSDMQRGTEYISPPVRLSGKDGQAK
ncbi:MAG: hypothetical protein QXI12_09045 [Candidatus Methanomethyliaceae archaeon]